jgi:hypothetical protein
MSLYIPSSGGVTSTVLHALVDPQINISSVGDTYTDTTGNTYAETTNQTRLTTTAAYKRYISGKLGVHVNANTGTVQLYNFTTSTESSNKTTTATSEETLAAFTVTTQPTTAGDIYTLRVKNSNAAGTFTIDAGGMIEGDSITEITADGWKSGLLLSRGGFFNSLKLAIVKGLSTASLSLQPAIDILSNNTTSLGLFYSIGSAITTLSSVQTISVSVKYPPILNSSLGYVVSSLVGQVAVAVAGGVSADDI